MNKGETPIVVALLGAGYIADFHLKALKRLPQVEIKAVCDVQYSLAEKYAKAKGIPAAYGNLKEMLEKEKLDVIHILTPPHIHYQNGCQIIEAGVDAFIEKPLCHQVSDCQDLIERANSKGRVIGVSHNFLYYPVYEKLVKDLKNGRLGKIDQIDIMWNKELGQIKGGPYGSWMLQNPKNILFEVCPHSFVHLLDLVGEPDSITVEAIDRVDLPGGLEFYRHWEIRGIKEKTVIRLGFSFIDGYPEHYIKVRGTNALAKVDFENNIYTCQEHTPYLLDIDRYLTVVNTGLDSIKQATGTLTDFLLGKVRLTKKYKPYEESIARTVESFYQTRKSQLDHRVSPTLGKAGVALGELIAQKVELPPFDKPLTTEIIQQEQPASNVLVIGGTGFIGKSLVRRLRQEGYGVRLMIRNPKSCPDELVKLGVELFKGDFTNAESVDASLEGIEYVYHLARGNGKTWADYQKSDVEPTLKLAELSLKHGVKKFFYASSIAIYYAGKDAIKITEETTLNQDLLRTAPYAKAKAESEKLLNVLYKEKGFPLVIFRPGVVLGSGGNPYHWGIAAWPYNSVCRLWGDGNNPLPIVLVDDVADAMVQAIKVAGIEGESYNLTSEPCITANEYLDEFERQAGIKIKRIPTSSSSHYSEALIKWLIKSIGRDPYVVFPSMADWEGRTFGAIFDSSKAQKELSWHPVKDRQKLIDIGIHTPVKEFCL